MMWSVLLGLLLASSAVSMEKRGERQLFDDASSFTSSSDGGVGLGGAAFILSPGSNGAAAAVSDNGRFSNFVDNSAVPARPAPSGYGAAERQSANVVVEEALPGYDEPLLSYGEEQQESQISQVRTLTSSGVDMLLDTIPGRPGQDYPIYAVAPATSFTCTDKAPGGYYADPEASCQSFHICGQDIEGGMVAYTFLCPNGTIFNQEYFICDWWFNVNCDQALSLAEQRNADLLRERQEAEVRAANRRAALRARGSSSSSSRLQGLGSARVETVVASNNDVEQAATGYRAAEASANVVRVSDPVPAPSQPVSSTYAAASDSQRFSSSSSNRAQETARVETVVRRVQQPRRQQQQQQQQQASTSYRAASESAAAPVIVEDLSPAPSASAPSGYAAAVAAAPAVAESVTSNVVVDNRVQQPTSGYRASEAASSVIEESLPAATLPAYGGGSSRRRNPFLNFGGNRRGFVVARRRRV